MVVVDVVVDDPPARVSTQASASASIATQVLACALQSPLLFAVAHCWVNLSSHLVSLVASTAVPVLCAASKTLSLQLTFLATAFVTLASQLDRAWATPPSATDTATSPPTANDLRMAGLAMASPRATPDSWETRAKSLASSSIMAPPLQFPSGSFPAVEEAKETAV
jgi:hypothetical protein